MKIDFEMVYEMVRREASIISDDEYWKNYADLLYLFTDMEAYGDRSYYQNKKTKEYCSHYVSIGD